MKNGLNPNSIKNPKPIKKGEVRNPYGKSGKDGKALMKELLDNITESGRSAAVDIAQKQIDNARRGDLDAAVFVFSYAYGRPGQQLDVSVSNKAEEIASMFPTPEELENALLAKNNP